MRFGDTRGAECNAGHPFGRAAAYLVIGQRGKPLVVSDGSSPAAVVTAMYDAIVMPRGRPDRPRNYPGRRGLAEGQYRS
jgi:hypothetical protein